MLLPKRVKHRKVQRGSMRGTSKGGTEVQYGEYGLKALEADHEYLLKGDVFTLDVIETWIDYKMTNEVQALALRPHPWEFALYYDI